MLENDNYEVIEEGALLRGSFVLNRATCCKDNAKQWLLKRALEPRINEASFWSEIGTLEPLRVLKIPSRCSETTHSPLCRHKSYSSLR